MTMILIIIITMVTKTKMTMMTTYPSNRDYHMPPMPHPPACPWNRTTATIHACHRQPVLSFIIITTNNTQRLRHPLGPGPITNTVIDATAQRRSSCSILILVGCVCCCRRFSSNTILFLLV